MSPELNIPVAFPIVFTVWTAESSFTHVIPVPGRTVSSWGTKVLFLIWMVVTTFVDGDVVLFTIGSTVVTTVVGNVVGARVNSAVGTIVGIVVGGVVTASCTAGWVHPVKKIKAIIRITKPIHIFMRSKLFLPSN
jgi:hypothetical protein